jgi:phosphoribosylamine-glycine ligase
MPEETEETINYPTKPDAEGWFVNDEDEAQEKIQTRVYDNNNTVKRVTLSNGKIATVRETIGKDMKQITMLMNKDQSKYQLAAITVATTIDGEKQTLEYFEAMKTKDLSKIMLMSAVLNF